MRWITDPERRLRPFLLDDDSGTAGGGDAGAGDDSSGAGSGTAETTRAEVDGLRRELAEARRAAAKATAAAKKAEDDKAAQQGEWQKLAEQRGAELEEAQQKLAEGERQQRVTRIATRLKFTDPTDAFKFVAAADADDDAKAEAALKQLLKDKPYLAAGGTSRRTTGEAGAVDGAKNDVNAWIRQQAGRT